jgi:hypothetical protein
VKFLYVPSAQSPFHWLLPSVLIMTPVFSRIQSHEREQEKAAELLQDACDRAFKTRGYNFIDTHKNLLRSSALGIIIKSLMSGS